MLRKSLVHCTECCQFSVSISQFDSSANIKAGFRIGTCTGRECSLFCIFYDGEFAAFGGSLVEFSESLESCYEEEIASRVFGRGTRPNGWIHLRTLFLKVSPQDHPENVVDHS